MRAIIFGAGGQDGLYLAELLSEQGIEAITTSRTGPVRYVDVGNIASVGWIISEFRPDYIFHLAARSTTTHAALMDNHRAISTGTLNVLEAARQLAPKARVFITGSAMQFRNAGEPIDEDTPFEASSPYAVARIHAAYAARYYRSIGLRAYVGYLFNHESPRRPESSLSRRIALAAQRIAHGSNERLTIGDPSVVKEWNFAGDVVRAMLTLVQQDEVTEAVIGSGEGHSIEEWLGLCFSRVGLDWREHVDPGEDFKAEYRRLVSKPDRMRSLGWAPRVTFEELAEMMVERQIEGGT